MSRLASDCWRCSMSVSRVGAQSFVKFSPPDVIPSVSLDPRNLPNYAARSTLRMFVALGCSTLFTFVYGYAAARSKRLERVLVPMLDILQSVPVLGFLSVTVTAFIALFRGSLLGLEAASIFAIFTGQAWNMAFSLYQSLRCGAKRTGRDDGSLPVVGVGTLHAAGVACLGDRPGRGTE